MKKILQVTVTVLIIFWILCCTSHASDILFVDKQSEKPSVIEQQIALASRFYGLSFNTVTVNGTDENLKNIVAFINKSKFQATIISASALNSLNAMSILTAIRKNSNKPIPLMIIGVTPVNGKGSLDKWSGGTVECCTNVKEPISDGFYRFSDSRDITQELTGQDIPFHIKTATGHGLIINRGEAVKPIMTLVNEKKGVVTPIFVKTNYDKQEVFIQTYLSMSELNEKSGGHYNSEHFIEIAPLLMFLRYTSGERCWHSSGHYANLTIDDPWLTEPYGHLNYKKLLSEMLKANFHTTIAFIPWNFDRSKPEVVSLFRKHSDKFSICIHGNNHDHQEFYKYETKLNDLWQAKPLSVQEANIKQALARMEEFKRLTGISYDRVMVFPHDIGPEKTLSLLKKYNFLATANTGNIPLGSVEPKDPLFYVRPFSLTFENFVSINRYSAKAVSNADIAINLFLGNPIFLYGHHDLFASGMDAFNKVAEFVNNDNPNVQWCSLGCIVKHLYLQRIRNDDNYDILSFSRSIEIKNTHKRDVTYLVRKEESFRIPIKQVTVNGVKYPHQRDGDYLSMKISIPHGESRIIEIEYQDDLNLSSVDISKNNLRVALLRKLSDFRDMTISRNPLGRLFIYYYYNTDFYKIGLMRIAIISIALIILITCVRLYFLNKNKKKVA